RNIDCLVCLATIKLHENTIISSRRAEELRPTFKNYFDFLDRKNAIKIPRGTVIGTLGILTLISPLFIDLNLPYSAFFIIPLAIGLMIAGNQIYNRDIVNLANNMFFPAEVADLSIVIEDRTLRILFIAQ